MTHAIFLVTHNRSDFVRRFVRFYERFPELRIYVASSGTDESILKINEIFEQSALKNFKIYDFDNEISFLEKINHALSDVSCMHIAFCGDDDYIMPEALAEAADYLLENPDYISVSGCMFTFSRIRNTNGHYSSELLRQPYRQISLVSNAPLARLSKHLTEYAPTFYNVYRVTDLLELINKVSSLPNLPLFTYGELELILSCYSVMLGKVHVLDKLYMIRQGHNHLSGALLEVPLDERIKSKAFGIYCKQFIRSISALYTSNHILKYCARVHVLLAFAQYVAQYTFFSSVPTASDYYRAIPRRMNMLFHFAVIYFKSSKPVKPDDIDYNQPAMIECHAGNELYSIVADLIFTYPRGIPDELA